MRRWCAAVQGKALVSRAAEADAALCLSTPPCHHRLCRHRPLITWNGQRRDDAASYDTTRCAPAEAEIWIGPHGSQSTGRPFDSGWACEGLAEVSATAPQLATSSHRMHPPLHSSTAARQPCTQQAAH